MMERWDLFQTYDLVRKRFDHKQEQLVRECARSVVDRQNFARFHFHEIVGLTESFEQTHLSEKSLVELDDSDELRKAFEYFIVKVGAHATACVQSVHAIPDILANALYYGCGLNLGSTAISEHLVTVESVVKVLKRDASSKVLADTLSKAVEGPDWEHLSAISNMSKHRSVIRSSLSEDWTGKRKNLREIQFAIFKRGEKQYWAKSLENVIRPECERLSIVVIESGNGLNRWLRESAA